MKNSKMERENENYLDNFFSLLYFILCFTIY